MSDSETDAAEIIKFLGKISVDGLQVGINTAFGNNSKKRKEFKEALSVLSKVFEERPEKAKKVKLQKEMPSSTEIFKEKILPQICVKSQQFEANLFSGKVHAWHIKDFVNFDTNFAKMTLDELKTAHFKMMVNEDVLRELELVFRYYRGKLYLYTYTQHTTLVDGKPSSWFPAQFQVSYDAALKLMQFSLLIQRFPRLLVCELSFAQFRKHNTNIQKHLESPEGASLAGKLQQRLDFSGSHDIPLVIETSEVFVPKLPFKIEDPDASYYPEASKEAECSAGAKSFENWMKDKSSTIDELLDPKDSTDTMMKEIDEDLLKLTVPDDEDEDQNF